MEEGRVKGREGGRIEGRKQLSQSGDMEWDGRGGFNRRGRMRVVGRGMVGKVFKEWIRNGQQDYVRIV
jgi:hypothetical protein